MADKEKRRPGRPPKGAKSKRGTFTFRVTEQLRTTLEANAAASGRSVSEEIEHQLQEALVLDKVMGDPKSGQLVRQVIHCIELTLWVSGQNWYTDELSRRVLSIALSELVDPHRQFTHTTDMSVENLGVFVSLLATGQPLRNVKTSDIATAYDKRRQRRRR